MASDESTGGGAAQHRHKDLVSLMQAMRPPAPRKPQPAGAAAPRHYVELDFEALDLARYEVALNAALYRQHHRLLMPARRAFAPLALTVQDLRGLRGDALELALQEIRAAMSIEDAPHGAPSACCATLHGDNKVRLHLSGGDASGAGMLDDAMHYYQHPEQPLPTSPAVSPSAFSSFSRVSRAGAKAAPAPASSTPPGQESYGQAMAYWLARLPALPRPPDLPRLTESTRSHSRPQRRAILLPQPAWDAFSASAARFGLAPASAVFAVFAEVMAQWSGADHFLLSKAIMQPDGAGPDLYPLEIDMRAPAPFHGRVRAIEHTMARDAQHAAYGGQKVWRALSQLHDMPGRAQSPYVVAGAADIDVGDQPCHAGLDAPQSLLRHQFCETVNGGVQFIWDVIEREFPEGMIDAMWQAQRTVLSMLADDALAWSEPVGALLPAAQRDQRTLLNATALPRPQGMLQQNLAWQAGPFEAKAAVVCGGASLTYGQLNSRSNQLAHQLRAAGAQPNTLVAVLLDKGWQQMVALHGIQLAGAAYVPIDPDWPETRIRALLDHSEARILVTRAGLRRPRLALAHALEVICVDAEQAGEADWPDDALEAAQTPEDLAYVMYGPQDEADPAGVMIDHRGALNTLLDINRRFGIGARDVLFGIAPLHADLSVYDMFGCIAAGATLVLPAPDEIATPAAWLDTMQSQAVTVWNSTPVLMQLLADAAQSAGATLPALTTVMLSGGRIPLRLLRQIRLLAPNARVFSLGGASEASIWSICHPVERHDQAWTSIPYGKPLANQRWHILDRQGNDAPHWTAGELYIGGIGLAIGYWRDQKKTAHAFVRHPRTGERLYRTGKRGRYHPDGNIEFLGRAG